MRTRLLPALAALVLALGACGLAGEPAIELGDREVSHGELADQLELFASHPDFSQVFFNDVDPVPDDGSYDREYVEQIMLFMIGEMLFEQAIVDLDLTVDPELTDQLTAQLSQPDPNLGGQSLLDLVGASGSGDDETNEALRERIVDYFVKQQVFQTAFTDQQAFSDYVSGVTSDITISERYGRFDPQAGDIVPPEGPTPSLEGTDVFG